MPEWTVAEVFEEGGLFSQTLSGYELRQPQLDLSLAIEHGMAEGHHTAAEGPTGCHVAGQMLLMFDGTLKSVEDILEGDLLMGPDSRPRKVLALARGEEEIVEVRPVKGEPWRVNRSHILSLVRTNTRKVREAHRRDYLAGETVDVGIQEWREWSRTRKHIYKLFRTGVDFGRSDGEELIIHPYHVGVLLGDGSMGENASVGITTADQELVDAAHGIAAFFELKVRVGTERVAPTYYICGEIGNKDNRLIASLCELGLRGTEAYTKFIPHVYQVASALDRLKLLAGLMDSDGHLCSGGTFDYISASRRLAGDVAFVARSVGLAAYVSPSEKGCKGFRGQYWRVSISGDVDRIPCRIPRKQASLRRQKKSVLRTGFGVVELGYRDRYYGFTLDGDGRYLLDDFTVTHNTGKSLAYLVPAIRQVMIGKGNQKVDPDGNRVVVATANIALQEQLYFKDLPFLADTLPDEFLYALVKGRNNYLCKDQLNTFRLEAAQGVLGFGADVSEVPIETLYPTLLGDERTICEWSERTETGDKSELEIVPTNEVWRKFSVTAEECLGGSCPHSGECHANRARKALQAMDVIVVNYHLLFAALKVRMETGKDIVLPSFRFLICDEAHKVANIARDFFGWAISKWTINRATTRFNKAIRQARAAGLGAAESRGYSNIHDAALAGMEALWGNLDEFYADSSGALRIREPDSILAAALAQSMGDMGEAFINMSKFALGERNKAEVKKYGERAIVTAGELREAMELSDDNGVYFMERYGKNKQLRLVKRLLYVGDMLWSHMFEGTDSTVITSATLAIEGDCNYIRNEVGMKEGSEVIVDSPFNFREQACIILSERAPDPKQKDYPERVSKVMAAIIEQAGGRTLGLFTSYRVLRHAAEYLRAELPQFRFLVQGEAPRMKLVAEFKEDVASVLLGTESFWTGVDVPGESLSCLVIDKIPFPSPGDPVLDALSDAADGQGFWKVSVPRAVLQFRQGVGRLIRRRDDRGVIIVLDNRLVTKGYGSIFTKSLPRMTRAKGIREGQIHHWLQMEGTNG